MKDAAQFFADFFQSLADLFWSLIEVAATIVGQPVRFARAAAGH